MKPAPISSDAPIGSADRLCPDPGQGRATPCLETGKDAIDQAIKAGDHAGLAAQAERALHQASNMADQAPEASLKSGPD